MIWTDLADGSQTEISDAHQAASVAVRRKAATSVKRLRTLAIKAAKYAKDPGSNPQLTAREINEFLARLALAEAADDQ